jgi:hypothetical protein
MNDVIQVFWKTNTISKTVPGVYRKRNFKHRAICALSDWVVDKLFTPYVDVSLSYSRVSVRIDDIVDCVFKHVSNIESVFFRKPKIMLIGVAQWYDIVRQGNEKVPGLIRFDIPTDYRATISPPEYRAVFSGMHVFVIPWIDGVVLLPELERI